MIFTGRDTAGKNIALTYDDGPFLTDYKLLNLLRNYDVRATFFMRGDNIRKNPEVAKAIYNAGHVIGNHTYNHADLTKLSHTEIEQQIDLCEAAMNDVFGSHSNLFRAPFGWYNGTVEQVVASRNLTMVMWGADSYDWQQGISVAQLERNVFAELQDGCVVLLHNEIPVTLEATENLIKECKRQDFEFLTVPQMILRRIMNARYWEQFYKNQHTIEPSPFAKWCNISNKNILDIGCGNGRDSYYLSQRNTVTGVDPNAPKSSEEVFVRKTIQEFLRDDPKFDVAYCRFFFHSIEKEAQDLILDWAARNKVTIYAEFRSVLDNPLNDHDRRLIDGNEFKEELKKRGFKIDYYLEGTDLAVYKNENPVVIRIIASC